MRISTQEKFRFFYWSPANFQFSIFTTGCFSVNSCCFWACTTVLSCYRN